MFRAVGWLVEQACRAADRQVCAIANLTDEDPDRDGSLFRIAPGRNTWPDDAPAA